MSKVMDCFTNNGVLRKRGRPAGKRRQPLNTEQKKARNAQYERERRVEIAEATSLLAEAVGVDQSVTVSNLLNTALKLIRKSSQNPPSSIKVLRERNEDLSKEIQDLERFLAKKKNSKKSAGGSKTDKKEKRGIKRKYENSLEQEPSTSSNNEQTQEDQDILFGSEFVLPSEFDLDIEPSDIWSTWFD